MLNIDETIHRKRTEICRKNGGDLGQADKVSRLDELEKTPCLTKQQLDEKSRIQNELRDLVFSRSKGLVCGGMNNAGAGGGGGEPENEARPSGENPIGSIFSPESNNSGLLSRLPPYDSSLPMGRPCVTSNGFPLIPHHEWPEIISLPQEFEVEESDRSRRYRISEVMRQADPGCQAALDSHEREFIRRNGIQDLRSVVRRANEHEGILRLITNEYMGPMSEEVLERFKAGEWAVEKRNLFYDEQGRARQT